MKKGILATLIIVSLTACNSTSDKGKLEFDTSNELASAQKYQDAIAYIQEAIKKAPKNQQYAARLKEIQSQYRTQVTADVQALLSEQVSKKNLDNIDRKLKGLESAGVSAGVVAQLNEQYKNASSLFYDELASEYENAKSAMDQQNWVSAITQLRAINNKFENYEDVKLRINTVESQALKSYVGQANNALKNDDFASAELAISSLLQVLPNNPIARNLQNKISASNTPDFFLNKAEKAMVNKQWSAVIENCKRALAYGSAIPKCSMMMQTATVQLSAQISEGIDQTIQSGMLFEATKLFNQLQSMGSLTAQQAAELKTKLVSSINNSADYYEQSGNNAMAWHLLKLTQSIDPYYPQLSSSIRKAEDAVQARSLRSIAVFDFNSPSQDSNSGVIVANNLISRLFNNASSDIRVIERDSLKTILDEMQVNQTNTVSETAAKTMGQVYGIDYAIIGSVLLYQVDENTSVSTKSIQYKIGDKIQDNIEYLNWKAVNPNPTKEELQTAPKAKIMVPDYGQKDYEVTQTKKVGLIQLSFRIVDVLTGENTRVDTIEKKMQLSDSSNSGIAEAGIAFDEMEIATDIEILQQLTDEIVENMASEILKPLQQLETYYLNEGTDKERRNEIDQAIQNYTYAIFNERLKSISNSPVSKAAQEKLDELLGSYRFKSAL